MIDIKWIVKGSLLQIGNKIINLSQVKYIELSKDIDNEGDAPDMRNCIFFYFNVPEYSDYSSNIPDEFGDISDKSRDADYIAYKGDTAEMIRIFLQAS